MNRKPKHKTWIEEALEDPDLSAFDDIEPPTDPTLEGLQRDLCMSCQIQCDKPVIGCKPPKLVYFPITWDRYTRRPSWMSYCPFCSSVLTRPSKAELDWTEIKFFDCPTCKLKFLICPKCGPVISEIETYCGGDYFRDYCPYCDYTFFED